MSAAFAVAPTTRPPILRRLRRYFAGPLLGGAGGHRVTAVPVNAAPGEGLFARQRASSRPRRSSPAASTRSSCTTPSRNARNIQPRHADELHPALARGLDVLLPNRARPPSSRRRHYYTLGSVLGAFFASTRTARVVVFTGMLEYFALRNSFGKIGHSTHLFVMTSFVLIFLPAGWQRPAALSSPPHAPGNAAGLLAGAGGPAAVLHHVRPGQARRGRLPDRRRRDERLFARRAGRPHRATASCRPVPTACSAASSSGTPGSPGR